jgi:hypothetical protein
MVMGCRNPRQAVWQRRSGAERVDAMEHRGDCLIESEEECKNSNELGIAAF